MTSKQVLLIDDDLEYQALISNALESANLRLNNAGNGESGFQIAKKNPPDIIILAVELPDSNGYVLCKKFREDETLKSIPVILISRDASPKDFEQHRKLKIRADEYLLKPFSDDVILSKVQNLIGFHISENEFELMQEHLNALIQEKIILDDRIGTLEKEKEELSNKLKEVDRVQNALGVSKNREEELSKQLSESKSHTKVIDQWLTEANDRVDGLKKENTELKKDYERIMKELKELQSNYQSLQEKAKKSSIDIEKLKFLLNQALSLLPKD
ncbi:MAG: response regulator [Deltaproteobacteria bacterium]|nr:response regulator [Deltaproteobacteria bacterium]MCL5792215.1 response regulator [Deltaproteobacteria bacterium]